MAWGSMGTMEHGPGPPGGPQVWGNEVSTPLSTPKSCGTIGPTVWGPQGPQQVHLCRQTTSTPTCPCVLPNLGWKQQQHPQLWAHSSHTSSTRGSPTLCSQALRPHVAQNPGYPSRIPCGPHKIPGTPKASACSDGTHSTRCPGARVPQPRPTRRPPTAPVLSPTSAGSAR